MDKTTHSIPYIIAHEPYNIYTLFSAGFRHTMLSDFINLMVLIRQQFPLDFASAHDYNGNIQQRRRRNMSEQYGDDIITITDEDGVEYILEILATMEIDGSMYYALVPVTTDEDEDEDLEVSILKGVDEDGEEILCAIEDEEELERVYETMMNELFSDEDEDEA